MPDSPNTVMADLISKKVSSFHHAMQARRLEILANIAYLCGKQNLELKGGHIREREKQYQTEVIANRILGGVMNDISVATKTPAQFDVIPAGTDEDDKSTAKWGDKILQHLLELNDFYDQRKSIVLWYDLDGMGWRKVYWDPFYRVGGMTEEGPQFEGEVVCEPVPNTEVIFDPRAKHVRSMKWIIHVKAVTLGEVRAELRDSENGQELYEQISSKAFQTVADDFESVIQSEFKRFTQDHITPPNNAEQMLEDDRMVNRYEFWHIIDPNMPQGAYAVAYGNAGTTNALPDLTVTINQPYPIEQYPHGQLPLIPSNPLSLDGIDAFAVSRISQARPLQRYYNKLLSQIGDNLDAVGNSVIFSPRESNLNVRRMDNQAGNVIEYDGFFKPHREPGVQVPGAFFAHLDSISRAIDEIFAFHEASRGIMPSGGPRSGFGLQVLQEADNTQLSPIVRSLDRADQNAAHQMLMLALANYSNERQVQIIGKDNEWVTYQLNPEQLRGKVNVRVRTGSSLPINKALTEQKAFMAWQSGLLGFPQDPNVRLTVLKTMDMGNFDTLIQNNAKDINFAQREFIKSESLAMDMPPYDPQSVTFAPDGTPTFHDPQTQELFEQYLFVPMVNSFDDHFTHLMEHGNWLKDKYWEYVGSDQPHFHMLAQVMVAHANLHQQAVMQQQVLAAQLQSPQTLVDEGSNDSADTSKE